MLSSKSSARPTRDEEAKKAAAAAIEPVRSYFNSSDKLAVHTHFPSGLEMVEEYSNASDDLLCPCLPGCESDLGVVASSIDRAALTQHLVFPPVTVRKTRSKSLIGRELPWTYEVGEPPLAQRTATLSDDAPIRESSQTPVVHRRDTRLLFSWRIRNLPYPKDTYVIGVDQATSEVVVRTTNKKYYVRLAMPDMRRAGISLDQSSVKHDWGANTLVIAYTKPQAILEKEDRERRERIDMRKKGEYGSI
ncbi:DPCD protein family-domain-containing protein [Polychytrium aggregatum]|uniref:DPCD protein family-domain-containing protein n=1 Tax=Polychytrium aggregatum TaxID=110093 RepID=UPI0022FE513C|nr:DPCD protein family-domain-containing protein [Polychytrium aggregatum]KAI9205752.1 DPCD protein family-domain-containing protein [Polychytrium aggregatum]